MINFYDYTSENNTEHNINWCYIPDHPYRMLRIGGSGSGKTNALLNLLNNQPYIDKTFYMQNIHMKQNINFYLTKQKAQD